MRLARWLGRRAAEVVMILRDKPMIPCQVEWPYRENFVVKLFPPGAFGDPNAPTMAELQGGIDVTDNFRDIRFTPEEDEDYLAVDTIGEYRKQRYPNE